jgi:hypothetical protein
VLPEETGRGREAAVGCGAAVLGVRGATEGTNAAAAALYLGLLSPGGLVFQVD